MKVRDRDGSILESHNDLVIEQWRKYGFTEVIDTPVIEAEDPAPVEKPKRRARKKPE